MLTEQQKRDINVWSFWAGWKSAKAALEDRHLRESYREELETLLMELTDILGRQDA